MSFISYRWRSFSPCQSLPFRLPAGLFCYLGVYYTLDVVSHLSFGKSFSMLRSADLRWIAEATGSYMTRSYMAMQYPSVFKQGSGKLLSADTWLLPHLQKKRERYMDATVRIVQQRIDEQHSEKRHADVMHYLLSAKDPETGKGLEISEIWSEAYLMINAGESTFLPQILL